MLKQGDDITATIDSPPQGSSWDWSNWMASVGDGTKRCTSQSQGWDPNHPDQQATTCTVKLRFGGGLKEVCTGHPQTNCHLVPVTAQWIYGQSIGFIQFGAPTDTVSTDYFDVLPTPGGSITGTVSTASGHGVGGVSVSAGGHHTSTDATGHYTLRVAKGHYTVRVAGAKPTACNPGRVVGKACHLTVGATPGFANFVLQDVAVLSGTVFQPAFLGNPHRGLTFSGSKVEITGANPGAKVLGPKVVTADRQGNVSALVRSGHAYDAQVLTTVLHFSHNGAIWVDPFPLPSRKRFIVVPPGAPTRHVRLEATLNVVVTPDEPLSWVDTVSRVATTAPTKQDFANAATVNFNVSAVAGSALTFGPPILGAVKASAAQALAAVGVGTLAAAGIDELIAQGDPFDPDFQVVAIPQPLPVPMKVFKTKLARQLVGDTLQMNALALALVTSFNRASSAAQANDAKAVVLQRQAIKQYLTQLADVNDSMIGLDQRVAGTLARARAGRIRITHKLLAQYRKTVQQSGAPGQMLNTLTAVGVAPDDILGYAKQAAHMTKPGQFNLVAAIRNKVIPAQRKVSQALRMEAARF